MSLRFDPVCQRAVDAAESCVPEGDVLQVGVLLGALYHGTDRSSNQRSEWQNMASGSTIERCGDKKRRLFVATISELLCYWGLSR